MELWVVKQSLGKSTMDNDITSLERPRKSRTTPRRLRSLRRQLTMTVGGLACRTQKRTSFRMTDAHALKMGPLASNTELEQLEPS
jgi:hypothetical protein